MDDKLRPGEPTRKPTNAESETARREALAMLRREFPRFAADHDDLAQNAAIYCHPRWDGERPYPAFVVWKAKLEALTRATATTRRAEVPLDDDAHAIDETEGAQTIETLRAKVLAECRLRLLCITGRAGEEWLANIHTNAHYLTPSVVQEMKARTIAARKILKALEGVAEDDWITSTVDMGQVRHYARLEPSWHALAARSIGIGYDDGTDEGGIYGSTAPESAVLSILAGSIPKLDVGMSVQDVVDREADTIRKAASKREREKTEGRAADHARVPERTEPPDPEI